MRGSNTLRTASLASHTEGLRAVNAEAVPSLCPLLGAKVLWLPEGKQANRGFSWLPVPVSQAHSQPKSPAPFLTTPTASLFKRQKEKIKNFRMG